MTERRKAGGNFDLMCAQERKVQLSKIVASKSEMPPQMVNQDYKYLLKEDQVRMKLLRELKHKERHDENERLKRHMSGVESTTPIGLKRDILAGLANWQSPGPVSLNIGNRVAFVKQVNKQNAKINKRLNSVRSVVPTAESLIRHDEEHVTAQRKFASRYAGLRPVEHIAKQANNKTHRDASRKVIALQQSISKTKLSALHNLSRSPSSRNEIGQLSLKLDPSSKFIPGAQPSIPFKGRRGTEGDLLVGEASLITAGKSQRPSRGESPLGRRSADKQDILNIEDGTEFKDKILAGNYHTIDNVKLPNIQNSRRESTGHIPMSAKSGSNTLLQLQDPSILRLHRGGNRAFEQQQTLTPLYQYQQNITQKKQQAKKQMFDLSEVISKLENHRSSVMMDNKQMIQD